MNNNYQQFINEYLEAPSTYAARKDGVPLELLDQLTPAEKERAADALIEKLSLDDSWPIVGLGHLGAPKAAPKLYALLPEAHGRLKAEIATALWKICQDEAMLQIVLELSRSANSQGPDWFAHVQSVEDGLKLLPKELAATVDPATFLDHSFFATFSQIDYIYCLAEFPQSEARARLEELTADTDYLVAYNARRALGGTAL